MLRAVRKLEPGYALRIESGRITRKWCFYELPYPSQRFEGSADEAARGLRAMLQQAVDRQLVADVEVGAFLSGGLDSSALAFYAGHHTAPPETFSIGFSASDRGDETGYAAEVARRAGSDNVRIDLGPANLGDLDPIIAALEEPLADSAVLPLWYLCRGTASHVKVALSG